MSEQDMVPDWLETTDLLALVPGPRPVWEPIRDRLVAWCGAPVTVRGPDEPTDDPCLAWSVGVEVDGRMPFVLWAEQVRPGAAESLPARGAACRWMLGGQTLFHPDDPLAALWWLVQTLVTLVPDTPSILDVNTRTWIDRPEIERLFLNPAVEPPLDQLWVVERVDEGDHATLTTSGLARCGLPDLEMHTVPVQHAAPAVAVMNAAVGLVLESRPLATAGGIVEVGPGLTTRLQPSAPGRLALSAATTPNHATGAAATWPYPRAVVETIAQDRAPLHVNPRVSARQASIAHATWESFRKIFVRVSGQPRDATPPVIASVKAPIDEDGDDREHVWFLVLGLDAERVQGRLLRTPLTPSTLAAGDDHELPVTSVSDWRVLVGQTVFGPDHVDTLARVIDERETVHS